MRVAFPRYPGASRKTHYLDRLGHALVDAGYTLVGHGYDEAPPSYCDFAVFWGYKNPIREKAEALCMPRLVCEMPYFGNRHTNASLSWNHFGRKAIRPLPEYEPRAHPAMRPWRAGDSGPIVVLGQCPRDYSVRGLDAHKWAEDTCLAALAHYGRRVVYREHPLERGDSSTPAAWDTEGFLLRTHAWLAISYSSTAAIKAVCAGVPTVAISDESMAWDVTSHSIQERSFPDREQWLHWLSYCQWTEDEFADGTALSHMLKAYDEARSDAGR